MDETCEQEGARLLKRTAHLKARTRALNLQEHSFSQAEHDGLREELRQHQLDLADYRRRCLNKPQNQQD